MRRGVACDNKGSKSSMHSNPPRHFEAPLYEHLGDEP